jgi:hypothetical protein
VADRQNGGTKHERENGNENAWRRRPPRALGHALVCLVSTSLGWLHPTLAAAAESTITVHAETPGAGQPPLSCTNADSLVQRVRALRPAGLGFGQTVGGTEPVAPHFEVTFSRRADRSLRAVVNVSGALSGERVLTDPGPSCDELGEALAVTLALLLDGSEVPESKPETVDSRSTVRGQILLQGGVVTGLLPSTGARVGMELVALPRVSPRARTTLELGAAFGYLPTGSTKLSVGEVKTSAFLGSLRAGARIGFGASADHGPASPPFALVPSVVATFGTIRAEGSGFDEEDAASRAFASVGLALPLVVEPASFRGFVLRLTPSVDVATRLQRFAVTGVPGSVGGRRVSGSLLLSAGLAVF